MIVAVLAGLGTQLNPNEAQLKNFPGTRHGDRRPRPARRRRDQPRRDEAAQRPRRERRRRRSRSRRSCAQCRGVVGATAPPDWQQRAELARRGRSPRSTAPPPASRRSSTAPTRASKGTNGTLTGIAAVDRDFLHALFGSFPYVLGLVLLLTLILLTRAFRSIVLAVKAVVLNLALARRRLRDRRLRLPAGTRLRALGHPRDRVDHRLDPGDDLRLPVRALDGLRGVHAHAHARGLRRDRLHRQGDRARARTNRQARDERRADPHVRLPRALDEPRLRDQAARDRPRGRDHLRRHRHPRPARAGADEAARRRELVDARVDARPSCASRAAEPTAEVVPRCPRRRSDSRALRQKG